MSFFDDSHVTDVGMEGSAGPGVDAGDMVSQGYRQQYRVDSALALEKELEDRWLESLRALEQSSGRSYNQPVDPRTYKGYAELLTDTPSTVLTQGRMPRETFDAQMTMMREADNAIIALENPEVKSFQQILEEVVRMQHEVEGDTASMSERTGVFGTIGSFIGAIGGSFSERDPLNVLSIGAGGGGRTIAMRVAAEMGIAGTITAATEVSQVQPNREFAGLPKRSLLTDVLFAATGAGVIRGGIEGIGAGIRAARMRNPVELDFEDAQLRQMFESNAQSPRARAGEVALDDIQFVEQNNPYGFGDTANARFLAELQDVQRVLGGAPDTAIARALPPVPFEAIEKAADFQIVKEQAPKVWARLEEAQAAVRAVNEPRPVLADDGPALSPTGLFREGQRHNNEVFLEYQRSVKEAPIPIHMKISDDGIAEISVDQFSALSNRIGPVKIREAMDDLMEMYHEIRSFEGFRNSGASPGRTQKVKATRRVANAQYREAFAAAEAEAARINRVQAALRGEQQADALDLLGNAMGGRTFVGSALTHSAVERSMARVAELAETQDARAVALFKEREDFGEAVEGETKPLAYEIDDGRIDIGLAEPVDPTFRLLTEDGDFSVREIMDDLTEDERLDEAMRTCLI